MAVLSAILFCIDGDSSSFKLLWLQFSYTASVLFLKFFILYHRSKQSTTNINININNKQMSMKKHMRYFLLWSCLILQSYVYGQDDHSPKAESATSQILSQGKDITIPFEQVNTAVCIQVTLDHSKPISFILDTGVKYAMIDLSLAKSLGLKLGDQVPVGGTGKNIINGNLLKSGSFSVVGLEGFTQPLFLAMPLDDIAKFHGHEIGGIIGFDFISQFVVEIDYVKNVITLHDTSLYQYHGHGDKIRAVFNSSGHLQVKADVMTDGGDTLTGTFILDNGNGAGAILYTPFVEKGHFLPSKRPTVRWQQGGGIGGHIDGMVGRVNGLKLGRFTIDNPVTVFSQATTGAFTSTEVQGNIGAGILRKFNLILDYSHNTIILEPNARFGEPTEYNRTGILLTSSGRNFKTFTIQDVLENSPASRAGLMKGDLLTGINGRPSTDYTLPQIRELFKDAKQCDLIVRRKNKSLQKTLKLARLI
jgi:hypothetical protein